MGYIPERSLRVPDLTEGLKLLVVFPSGLQSLHNFGLPGQQRGDSRAASFSPARSTEGALLAVRVLL